jgi:hypothetical protein
MRELLFVFLLPIILPAQGTYRWDVKLGIDTAGQRIYKKKYVAEKETVQNLGSKTANPKPSNEERKNGLRADAEKRKVTVTGYVTDSGTEEDGDYHLVIKALSGSKTLIAEIPDPTTPKLKNFPGYKSDYKKARKEVDDKIGEPGSSVEPLDKKRKVKITGYVLFDKTAHGNGHANNDVEIHPVLEIKVLD